MHLEIPQLKSMGNIPFGRFSVTQRQTPNPVILHHSAIEISQLKWMGNVAYVCISKNKPLNPYPVVLYKIVGSPPPHLCKKICVFRFGRLGCRWQQVAIHASGNPPTKVNGKYSVWPILCKQAPNTQPCYIASVCGGLTLLFLEKNPGPFPPTKVWLV